MPSLTFRFAVATRTALAVVAAGILLLMIALPAQAQVDPQVAIRQGLSRIIPPGQEIDEIRPTPMANLYEVRLGATLIYVDGRGQYALIEGQLIDIANARNLTRDRLDDVMRIDFARDLPTELAFKQVIGNGKRKLAVFEDPNCTYCRKLRAEFEQLKDVTIYTYPYAILSPDSEVKARKAWCAKDPMVAWNAMLTRGTVPNNAGECDNPVAKVRELGRQLGVEATPTMFFPSGKRVPGAISRDRLEQLLDGEQSAAAPGRSPS